MNNANNELIPILATLEADFSLPLREGMGAKLQQYIELLLEWNSFARLVSKTDEAHIVSRHIVDSLSLVKVVEVLSAPGGSSHLDIGAGGGFPSIPMAILLPEIEFISMERSAKKSTFLRKTASDLSLSNLKIIPGLFPDRVPTQNPSTVTARAVENPSRVLQSILEWLPSGCTFLCQLPSPADSLGAGFECTAVHDAWSEAGHRRGALHLIQRID